MFATKLCNILHLFAPDTIPRSDRNAPRNVRQQVRIASVQANPTTRRTVDMALQ